MDQWWDAYRRDQERRNLSPRTIRERRHRIGSFLRWLAPRAAPDATRADVEGWIDSKPLGPRSRSLYISTLHTFYAFLLDAEMVPTDPTVKVTRPRVGRLLPHPMSGADLKHAIAMATPRMAAWLALAAFDGLRCREIAMLRTEDVRIDADPALLVVRQGKGDKDRILPLNPLVALALRSYGLPNRGFLFLLNDGRPIPANTLSAYGSRYLHGLGLSSTLHSARHYFGTEVYRESHDLRLTQELLGHADPKTTAIYTEWDPVEAAEVVSRLGMTRPVGLTECPNRVMVPDSTQAVLFR